MRSTGGGPGWAPPDPFLIAYPVMLNGLMFAAAPAEGGLVDSITGAFGLNWQMFLSQLVAFLIVAGILKKFAYGPILQLLEERRQRIAEAQANSEKIKAELARTEALRQDVLVQANAQATRLIEEARAAADKERVRLTQDAVVSVSQMIARAKEASDAELARLKTELRREVGRLVVETTAQVTGKILTLEDRQRLAEQANKDLAA